MLKERANIIFLVVVAFFNAYLFGGQVANIIFFIVILSVAFSYVSCFFAVRKLSGFQSIKQNKYETGDEITIESIIDNDSFFVIPYLELRDKTFSSIGQHSNPVVMMIGPLKRKRSKTSYVLQYRGVYNIGPIELLVQDSLRIFSWVKKINGKKSFMVYPKIYNINNLDLQAMQSLGVLSNRKNVYEDNTSISNIRKYTPGDSIKKVHWKLSAKQGKLYVKSFEKSGSNMVYIYMDFAKETFKGDYAASLEERSAETVCSICYYLLKRTVPTELCIINDEMTNVKGRSLNQFTRIHNLICQIKPCGNRVISDVIKKRLELINTGASIIIVAGSISKEAAALYSIMRKNGYDLMIIYVSDNDIDCDIISNLQASGIMLYIVRHDSDIGRCLCESEV